MPWLILAIIYFIVTTFIIIKIILKIKLKNRNNINYLIDGNTGLSKFAIQQIINQLNEKSMVKPEDIPLSSAKISLLYCSSLELNPVMEKTVKINEQRLELNEKYKDVPAETIKYMKDFNKMENNWDHNSIYYSVMFETETNHYSINMEIIQMEILTIIYNTAHIKQTPQKERWWI